MAKRQKRHRSAPEPDKGRGGFFRILGRVVLVLVVIPLVLTPIYIFVPPVSTLMIYERVVRGPIERQWVSFDAIAQSLVASAVMSEDQKYCSHWGVDWGELDRVLAEPDERPRGASTIPMQTVKNLFLWQSRSYIRKAIEIPLAIYANAVLGKKRQMEIYLNIAEFGPSIFGVEAASRHYFGRSAAEVSEAQAALLVAALPNPAVRNPGRPGPRLRARAARIAAQARIAGAYIDCLYP